MYYIISIFLIICSLTGNAFSQESVAVDISHKENVTIFIYHKFGEDRYPTTNVAVDRFAEQLQFLGDNGYAVLPLADIVKKIHNQETLPIKAAVITIDDGYSSIYDNAWPLLKKYKNFLTWQQIKEMQDAGVDFQDHGYSHHRFGERPDGMDEQEYRRWIKDDLIKGNDILTRHLGYKPMLLALPYGEYNTIIQEEAKSVGYDAVFSQDPGSVSSTIDLFAVPREPILGNEWASMPHFEKILKRRDLPFTNMLPQAKPLFNSNPDKFCVDLNNPKLYRENSLGIYVSELGWQKGNLHEGRLCVDNNATLIRRYYRVAVCGIENDCGKTAIRYWLLMK
jgi:peptidoglycan/xylan/chitin deacetylase (PgdA/CDA1 family)